MHQIPPCPVCSQALHVERLRCAACQTAVEGQFQVGRFSSLSPEQLAFVDVFVRNRGKIKDVEAALGLSYPTVVARLDEVVSALEGPSQQPPQKTDRRGVLEALAAGRLSPAEAQELLKR